MCSVRSQMAITRMVIAMMVMGVTQGQRPASTPSTWGHHQGCYPSPHYTTATATTTPSVSTAVTAIKMNWMAKTTVPPLPLPLCVVIHAQLWNSQ